MERLTVRDFVFSSHYVASKLQSWSIAECLKKLQQYENAEEDGRLVVPPCNIGDTAFFVINGTIYEAKISVLQWYKHSCGTVDEIRGDIVGGSVGASFSEFGKTVFLTREEAEAALKRMVK